MYCYLLFRRAARDTLDRYLIHGLEDQGSQYISTYAHLSPKPLHIVRRGTDVPDIFMPCITLAEPA